MFFVLKVAFEQKTYTFVPDFIGRNLFVRNFDGRKFAYYYSLFFFLTA